MLDLCAVIPAGSDSDVYMKATRMHAQLQNYCLLWLPYILHFITFYYDPGYSGKIYTFRVSKLKHQLSLLIFQPSFDLLPDAFSNCLHVEHKSLCRTKFQAKYNFVDM